jgi:hypothetical protein
MEQQLSVVVESIRSFMMQLGEFLPKAIGAIIILIVGWFVAKFLTFIVVKGLKLVNFNVLTDKAGIDAFLKKGGLRKGTIDILGVLIYWLVILATLLVAFNALGLYVVSDLVGKITLFIPNVIVAVLILTIGLYFARFVEEAVVAYGKNVGLDEAPLIGKIARWAIMVFVVLLSLGQMNIADQYLQPAFTIILGGIVLALALAFGIGGQKWAAEQLDKFSKNKK